MKSMSTLYIVATPIGNMEDITIRAIKTLFSVDIIACEDTRRTGLLLQELRKRFHTVIGINKLDPRVHTSPIGSEWRGKTEDDISTQFFRFDDRSESKRVPEIIELLIQGKSVALISDAGTPMLSDPGFLLVHECIKRNIKVVAIPGPSALLTGLVASGLPSNQVLYLGFFPEKQSSRIKIFTDLLLLKTTIQTLRPTVVFYCAPHKLMESLKDLEIIFPLLHISVARELTKIHETVWSGPIHDAVDNSSLAKGEITLLFTLSS